MDIIGEIVRVLRLARDVLAEYVAVERRKQAEVRQRAEELARRKTEEAAARAAEEQALRERLLARKPTKPASRGRVRRGEGPRPSVAIEPRPIPVAQPDAFRPPAQQALPPSLLALLAQFSNLHAAILDFFTATTSMKQWFDRVQTHPTWKLVAQGVISGMMMAVDRLIRKAFRHRVVDQYMARYAANLERVERMTAGDWTEAVRYIVWANKQHRETPRLARGGAMAAAGSW